MKVFAFLTAAAAGTSLRGQDSHNDDAAKALLAEALAKGTTFEETTISQTEKKAASSATSSSSVTSDSETKASKLVTTFGDDGEKLSETLKEQLTFKSDSQEEKASEVALVEELIKEKKLTTGQTVSIGNETFLIVDTEGDKVSQLQAMSAAESASANSTNITEVKALLAKKFSEGVDEDGNTVEVVEEVAAVETTQELTAAEEQAKEQAKLKEQTKTSFEDTSVFSVGDDDAEGGDDEPSDLADDISDLMGDNSFGEGFLDTFDLNEVSFSDF